MEIKHEHRVFYVGDNPEDAKAKMTYSLAGDSRLIADHTEVSDDLRGQGVGLQLLKHLVEFARSKNYKIVPLCPFVKAEMDKSPESYEDVRS